MHVPAQLAEAVPIGHQIGPADQGRRMERLPLACAQLDEAGERRRAGRGRDAVPRGLTHLRRFPLRGARLRFELHHLRTERDHQRLVDDPHELRGAVVARAEMLVVETARHDRQEHGVLGAPIETMTVHDAVAVALDAEDRDAALMRVAPARHTGVIAHEHHPLREGELLELRHDVELARALAAVDDGHLGALDVQLPVVRALVELLPPLKEAFIVTRLHRVRDRHASFLPFVSARPSSGSAPKSRESWLAVAMSARAVAEVFDSETDDVVPTIATAAMQWSP